MSMITVNVGADGAHEYASGISAGEVILNVHGKRSGAVAALIDGVERDFSFILDSDCSLEPINGESEAGLYILRHSCAPTGAGCRRDVSRCKTDDWSANRPWLLL